MNHRNILAVLAITNILFGCVSDGGTRIDNVPMYGQPKTERPAFLKKADEDFIQEASSGLGSREAASRAWHAEGERFMAEGNLDYAMRRYNQSWLLNPDNYQPYWGFARVMVAKRQYDEAFKYFDRAKELIDDPYEKPALITDQAIAYHNKASTLPKYQAGEKAKYYSLANSLFEESTKLDPTYSKPWLKWAYSLYFQQDYPAAWRKVNKSRELAPDSVPESFLEDLRSKMPEPTD